MGAFWAVSGLALLFLINAPSGGLAQVRSETLERLEEYITDLQDDVRELRGRVEKLEHLAKSSPPGALVPDSSQSPTPSSPFVAPALPTATAADIAKDPAKAAYNKGLGLLEEGQFQQARMAFEDFRSHYKTHPLEPLAQYWVGASYFMEGDHKKARALLETLMKLHPGITKKYDVLLKIAKSAYALEDTPGAIQALSYLLKTLEKDPKRPEYNAIESEARRLMAEWEVSQGTELR
jgi:TolA-binding protein